MAHPVPFTDAPLPGSLPAVRAAALKRWRDTGLPGPAVEAWKYTNLATLGQMGLVPAAGATSARVPEADVAAVDGYRCVFVNGRFDAGQSRLDGLSRGVTVEPLSALIARDDAAAETALGALDALPMAALNAAFATDGLVLRVARGAVLDKPLHVISIGASDGGQVPAFHPRHLIRLEADAVATVVESHVGTGAYLANSVSDVALERGATLKHYALQNEAAEAYHVGAVRLSLADRAAYEGFGLQLGARLARRELRATIDGSDVECRMNGLYLAAGSQHLDNTTAIDHAAPGSRSRQLFKGVLDDASRGVFQGRVLVRQVAQKTDAHQLSRALLLSRKAEMDGKPELEIYADDVRCSHGATIGNLDQEPMFYLRSRGIDEQTAYRMLVEAFAIEAIDEISAVPVREAFAAHVTGWLAGRRTGAA